MKRILLFLISAFSFQLSAFPADVPETTATITVTNTTGVTNGATITVNGSIRTWTNTIYSPSTQILVTNTIATVTTNLLRHLQLYSAPTAVAARTNGGGTNIFILVAPPGQTLTVSSSGGYMSVTYTTNYYTNGTPFFLPYHYYINLPTRTNLGIWMIDFLNAYASGLIDATAGFMGNFATVSTAQTLSNKTAQTLTVNTTLNVGGASSLSSAIVSNNATVGGSVSANSAIVSNNVTAGGSVSANSATISNNITANGIGTFGSVSNTPIDGGALRRSNLVQSARMSYTNGSDLLFYADLGSNHLRVDENGWPQLYGPDGATAATAGAESSAALLNVAVAQTIFPNRVPGISGYPSNYWTSDNYFESPTQVFRNGFTSTNHNSYQGTNQGTVLKDNILTSNPTNAGSWTANWTTVSTLANGHNTLVIPAGATAIRLSAGPTTSFYIDAMTPGWPGRCLVVWNNIGQTMSLVNESNIPGIDPTNRITTLSGGDRTFTGDVVTYWRYSGTTSRWILEAPDNVTAGATNAIGYLNGSGTNLIVRSDSQTTVPLRVYATTNAMNTNTFEVWGPLTNLFFNISSNGNAYVLGSVNGNSGTFTNTLSSGGPATFGASVNADSGTFTNKVTNNVLAASSFVASDANKALTTTLPSQSANTAFLGPASGSSAAPTFRKLVNADRPTMRQYSEIFDEFMQGTLVTGGPFAWINSASVGSASLISGETNAPGIVQNTTSTSTTGSSHIRASTANYLFGGGGAQYTLEARVRIPTLLDGTDSGFVRIGFVDNATATPVDGVYFRYSNTNANWRCITVSNSTETDTDSGLAVVANTWYKLRIVVNSAATSTTFTIDDANSQSPTTNIPSGAGRQTGIGLGITKTAGTNARTQDTDYVWLMIDFNASR